MSAEELKEIRKVVEPHLEKARTAHGLNMILFMLTNIITESSELLCCGPEALIEQMTKLHQFAIMCAPTNSQYAAVEGLRNCEDEVEEMRKSYDQRRRFLMHEFARMGLECFEPFGAFYVFPSIREFGMSSEEFAIAVDIDYTVFSADIIGVTANGTAVKVEERLDRRGVDRLC